MRLIDDLIEETYQELHEADWEGDTERYNKALERLATLTRKKALGETYETDF